MSGLRRAMPFTFGRSWSRRSRWRRSRACPATSRRTRSSRSRPSAAAATGSSTWSAPGRALMTAFYAFRMVFRVFWRRAERGGAGARAAGTSHHAEPVNPSTGEPRGHRRRLSPGPSTTSPSARRRCGSPMAILAVLAIVAGVLQIPGVTHVIESFLDPTFADSRFAGDRRRRPGSRRWRWRAARVTSLPASAWPGCMYVRAPGDHRCGSPRASAACTGSSSHKWYFDEALRLLDRAAHAGARARRLERLRALRDRTAWSTGTAQVGARRATRVVRVAQSGLLRNYALLLVTGVTGARPLLPGGEPLIACSRAGLPAPRRRRARRR